MTESNHHPDTGEALAGIPDQWRDDALTGWVRSMRALSARKASTYVVRPQHQQMPLDGVTGEP